ncbi:MAG: hypothetical protein ACMUIM_02100 [bacterium]
MKRINILITALLLIFLLCFIRSAQAGRQVVITDPLFFERPQEVIFPWADAKLVSFEFVSVSDDAMGKVRAKELHDLFLRKISGLPGGAVITYITPPGEKITNYRFQAEKVAREQKAQMALWGRILLDKRGTPLINARLSLIEPPAGINSDYYRNISLSEDMELPVSGTISDMVTQRRIDFVTSERDVTHLAEFLSGLAHYYKGAKKSDDGSVNLLKKSLKHFEEYLRLVSSTPDAAAESLAHLYMARAHFLIGLTNPGEKGSRLSEALSHAEKAAELNPYEADTYTVQAVILTEKRVEPQKIYDLVSKAVRLAPDDANTKVNLALIQSGEGKFKEALHQLEGVSFIQSDQKNKVLQKIENLQQQLMDTYYTYIDRPQP